MIEVYNVYIIKDFEFGFIVFEFGFISREMVWL